MPVGIPVGFGFLLYKNREALTAADDHDDGMSYEVFKKTVKNIVPDATFSDSYLETLYNTIDADGSGDISLKELVRHTLLAGREPDGGTLDDAEESPAASAVTRDEASPQEWWRGGAQVCTTVCLLLVMVRLRLRCLRRTGRVQVFGEGLRVSATRAIFGSGSCA